LGAGLLFALALWLRPNLAPGAAVLLGGAGLAALWRHEFGRLAGLCAGFLPVFGMALHNWVFGQVFVLPKGKILDTSAKVPGTDGEKMSKSYNNTLEIFEDPQAQRKRIMRIVTDSRPMEQPKEPESDHLFQLFSLVAADAAREEMAALYRRGGFGYGQVKQALADAAEQYFAEARARRAELAAQPQRITEILADGASRARRKAAEVLGRAKKACGLI
jgi:tryptophanyl-tRNA synthetase